MKRIAMLSVLLLAGLTGFCLAAVDATRDVVAQFGATRFTDSDLKAFVNTLDPDTRRQALADPQALRPLIQLQLIRKAIYSEALAKNWQQRPDIAGQVETARQAIVLKSYLTALVAVPKDFPSEQEIQGAYNMNRDKFMVPRQYHLAQIFIASAKADPNAAAARKKVDDLVAKLHANSGAFAVLAKQNSQHKPSAQKGGDMGWLTETQIMPEMRSKISGIARGEISDPVHSDEGWHILRVIDTKPPAPRTLTEMRPVIVSSMRQQRLESEEQQYIARMLQRTPVVLNDAQLRKSLVNTK